MSTQFDELRKKEFSRLDAAGHVYLDYTGAGLYAESQIRAHADLLMTQVLGNPHSQNPTSLAATKLVEGARERILEFFRADPDEYTVIFTLNASGALKLVGESYPFEEGGKYVLASDNHNSVNGIREFARSKGAEVRYIPLDESLQIADISQALADADSKKGNLFCYPAQSNFSGVKHPLEWIELAQGMGYDVLLDAAAFAPTSRIDLSIIKPDFMTLSFYKMFGFPTGVGALIARRETLQKLVRPWFAGGTVRFVSAQNDNHLLYTSGEAFEDGTLNFLSIAAITTGLDFIDSVGIENINKHVTDLTAILLDELSKLKHSNGEPIVDLYGAATTEKRGGTVSFNVLDPAGQIVDSQFVEDEANKQTISLRTGCFCNPGAAETAFNYEAVDAYECYHTLTPESFSLQQFSSCMHNSAIGAVRISVGIASNEADVRKLISFMDTFIDCKSHLGSERPIPEIVGE